MKKVLNRSVLALFFVTFLYIMVKGPMMIWLGIFGISLLLSPVFGKFYCGWVCPMNALMIPAEWLSKKMHWQVGKPAKWVGSERMSWIIALLAVLAMVIGNQSGNTKVGAIFLVTLLFLSFLVTLRYKPEVFHNNLCPFGVLLRLGGKFAIFSNRVLPDSCIGCQLCETTCPSKAIVVSSADEKAHINSTYCHQCVNCQIICPTDAIHYESRSHRIDKK